MAIFFTAVGSMLLTLLILIGIICGFIWLVMADLLLVMSKLLNWVKRGSNFLLVIFPVGFSVASIPLLTRFRWGLDCFRVIGIVIEIMGLLTVVWSLVKESKKYNHAGYHKSFINWVFELKSVLKQTNGCFGAFSMTGGATIGSGALTVSTQNFKDVDEKVEYLLKRVIELQTSIDANHNLIERVKNELNEKIDSVTGNLSHQISILKDELRDKATLDYYMLISGSWLTVTGMVMTNTPDRIFEYLLRFPSK
ncbi:hypothetical protein GMLC_22640 [Geomonas limicola]|uniref:Uncharacterized protein n=1 Tax=Geomonas limicola TaxID=2740186 RepID=A0A6V8N7Z8_9BACT|nr:hypothetical protein [Geomonas limicola]GFO68685.1 hypothetical protein GMLC_22640 [Geomonas limicola]